MLPTVGSDENLDVIVSAVTRSLMGRYRIPTELGDAA